MPQHVPMHRERKAASLACASEHLAKAGRRHRRAALGREHMSRLHCLALELAQGPQLPTPERMHTGPAVLDLPDVQQAVLEVDLIPAQRAQLGDGRTMHRVRIGPFTKPEQMNPVRTRLAEAGFTATVVKANP
jgi:hypothetical protein